MAGVDRIERGLELEGSFNMFNHKLLSDINFILKKGRLNFETGMKLIS